MKKICVLISLALLGSMCLANEPEVEDNVLVLTDANIDEQLAKNSHFLVEFYAPWCGHCKSLAPEYAKAAKRLRENNPPYYIAKIDATAHEVSAKKYGVKGFPTLFFFINGKETEYTGGRTENEIVNWILKRVGPSSEKLDCAGLTSKMEASKLGAAFFGEEGSEQHKIFLEVAGANEKYTFTHSDDKACAASVGADHMPAVVVYRKFDTPHVVFNKDFTLENLNTWLDDTSVPTLIEFSEDYIEPIFGKKQPAVFLFRKESDAGAKWAKEFEHASKELKGEIIFVVSDVEEGIQKRLAEFIGVEPTSLPSIRLLNPTEQMKKYTYGGEVQSITVADVKKFVQDFKDNKLVPFLKSQEIPTEQTESVVVIVGKSFPTIVQDPTKDVLIEFYAPWCGHCKQLAPIWEELATELKPVKDLVIAKMDSTANEVDGIEIRGYPTLKWFPKDNKAGAEYDGERKLEDFKNWLKEHSSAYKAYLENKSEL